MVVVAAGARGVARAAVETDPLGRRVGHVELRAVATRVIRDCAGIETNSVQRIRDGAHGTIKFSGRKRALELWIRGHLDTQALLGGLGPGALLSLLVAGRLISRLPRAVGLVVGTTCGNDLPHAHAALGRDTFGVTRGAPVRRAARAATAAPAAATTARRGRAGCPKQQGCEDNLVKCHRPRVPRVRLLRAAAVPGKWRNSAPVVGSAKGCTCTCSSAPCFLFGPMDLGVTH